MFRKLNDKHKAIAFALLVGTIASFPYAEAHAQVRDLTSLINQAKTQFGAVPDLFAVMFQIAGIWFAGKVCFLLKEIAENGRDPELTKKVGLYGLAAVALISLPVAFGVGITTVFGTNAGNLTTTTNIKIN